MASLKNERLLMLLKKMYPRPQIALSHGNAFELLAATILSAQCTDEQVNKVTPILFSKYPTGEALSRAKIPELEAIIHSTGFYHNKAKNLLGMAQAIVTRFHGQVPQTMEELITLPGVARKTANVVLQGAFRKVEGIVVDTHVARLAQRLGFTQQTQPEKIEQALMKKIPRQEWEGIGLRLIWHGRRICHAKKPLCLECPLNKLCPTAFKII
jgi:endonuclease III